MTWDADESPARNWKQSPPGARLRATDGTEMGRINETRSAWSGSFFAEFSCIEANWAIGFGLTRNRGRRVRAVSAFTVPLLQDRGIRPNTGASLLPAQAVGLYRIGYSPMCRIRTRQIGVPDDGKWFAVFAGGGWQHNRCPESSGSILLFFSLGGTVCSCVCGIGRLSR
jgi:hypothetical protein